MNFKTWLRQTFCRHDWRQYPSKRGALRFNWICKRCGKEVETTMQGVRLRPFARQTRGLASLSSPLTIYHANRETGRHPARTTGGTISIGRAMSTPVVGCLRDGWTVKSPGARPFNFRPSRGPAVTLNDGTCHGRMHAYGPVQIEHHATTRTLP